jgi:ATP-dependent helicase Lhr and Lhr-like helicase
VGLEQFGDATREWFAAAFAAPTPAQDQAWDAISAERHALVVAPTGSGKTLAAFLWSLDRLAGGTPPPEPQRRCRVLYVSPLKALAVDVERNLRAPLTGITHAAARLGQPEPDITVGMRTGDTPAEERRAFGRRPPDILITTPESLFLLLTSAAREALRGVQTVIVDEVHAVAGSKRGAHLALSLERLDALLARPAQRIGLSATVSPVPEMARFLGGAAPVAVIQPATPKTIEVSVQVPVADMTDLATGDDADDDPDAPRRASIWPAVEQRVFELIRAHRSTIVFTNARRSAERLCARLNEIAAGTAPPEVAPAEVMAQSGSTGGAPPVIARAHHGSVSKQERKQIEEALKSGSLPAVVATSSLELGIDMGAVDLVVQVETPPSVAAGLQRVGRAGHHVGAVSTGVMFPKHRGDLLSAAVVASRMRDGQIEQLHYPRNPLDVLAQQVVAMVAMDTWRVDDLTAVVRRAAPFAELPDSALTGVLDMLSGRYPSTTFAELRPRLVWDRDTDTLTGRRGAQHLAVTSGGTIPDRGLFGVFLAGAERPVRVGELDEEMVYESRVGDVFLLGSTSWRIEEITPDRVLVSPAPGQAARMPFWKGDTPGRPLELGRAIGARMRALNRMVPQEATQALRADGLDEWAADNLVSYLAEQRQAVRAVPDDRTVVVERFRDELGDWRLAVHCVLGAKVNAPWALAVGRRLAQRYGVDAQVLPSDDGIVVRLPDMLDEPPGAELVAFDPEEIAQVVEEAVGGSALFAARFRECAARSLLLPRRDPRRRQPLWQQRQRAAQLLDVAREHADFPITLEAARECLQDVFDVPGLTTLMRELAGRKVRLVEAETPRPSPFARSLLFGYVGAFLYEGDAPLAERRAAALALDSTLLGELLGRVDLRELLDAEVVAATERQLQWLTATASGGARVRDADDTAELLRVLGDLSEAECADRGVDPAWLRTLETDRRALLVRIAGQPRWTVVEDAGRYAQALGAAMPPGVPDAHLAPVDDPLGDLVARYARTRGPFDAAACATRFGLGVAVAEQTLRRLQGAGRVVAGEFTPEATGTQWCDAEVLRLLRRRSLAALRREIEPVPPGALATFLPHWQQVGSHATGVEAVAAAVEQLQGVPVPASALEQLVLPARVDDYTPSYLDELCASGEVTWSGAGAIGTSDGWVMLSFADTAPLLLAPPQEALSMTPRHEAVLAALDGGQALFFRALADRVATALPDPVDDPTLVAAIWDLVWAGHLSNDTLAPLRSLLSAGTGAHRRRPTPARSRYATAGGRASWRRRSRAALPSRGGPPTVAGRWHRLPVRDTDPTRRATILAETLLERHGVVTRGAVAAEGPPGGFAGVYPVLAAMEERGTARRGYFVEGLGAAQFAAPGAVDRLRAGSDAAGQRRRPPTPLVLAATDPANPYGAALPWPQRPVDAGSGDAGSAAGHRAGRKAGALVVLVDGALALYVERGGRTLLSYTDGAETLAAAAKALADAVHAGALGALSVERADGAAVRASPLHDALTAAGFRVTPRGLRLRG